LAFGGQVDLVVDGGPAPELQPSTIVKAVSGIGQVLREGPLDIPAEDLRLP
jgi:tRNA A37 threonylcarbamoyladenosine synthetase subunit TsaC/SUA5/YrdC